MRELIQRAVDASRNANGMTAREFIGDGGADDGGYGAGAGAGADMDGDGYPDA